MSLCLLTAYCRILLFWSCLYMYFHVLWFSKMHPVQKFVHLLRKQTFSGPTWFRPLCLTVLFSGSAELVNDS